MDTTEALSPSQEKVVAWLARASRNRPLLALWCRDGLGRTTMMRALHARLGGTFLGAGEILERLSKGHPLAVEEAVRGTVGEALASADTVFVDDLHRVDKAAESCHMNPRGGIMDAVAAEWCERLAREGKRLVLGVDSPSSDVVRRWGYLAGLQDFEEEDYRHLFRAFLGDRATDVDVSRVVRFFPSLSALQIRSCAASMTAEEAPDTRAVLDWLRDHVGGSNVDPSKVEPVNLSDLKGVDDVVEALERHLVLPILDEEAASRLRLRPKKGVLLYGPPGTGKTTVGRALAHRLGAKFFRIDGTAIAGTQHFYSEVFRVFEAARLNRPSVVFVDDTDVLFENREEAGFYRYLLTHLDGLESQGVLDVCLVLTAMHVGQLPPALIRSGRIELWLEMRPPDEAARKAILEDRLRAEFPPELPRFDAARVAAVADGLTGADLRRLASDARHLHAYDVARGRTPEPMDAYADRALADIRKDKERLAGAIESGGATTGFPLPRSMYMFGAMPGLRRAVRPGARSTPDPDDES